MRWLPYGPHAALVECGSLSEMSAVRATVAAARLPDVVEIVPGARSVLVVARPGTGALQEARQAVEAADLAHPPSADPREVELVVHYEGEDLPLVAETAGISVEEVVRLHTSAEYTVAFTGFAPGFAYLTGLPEPLRQSRLDTPRTKVPAGSVGLAGEFTGVYPRSSPGGWRLLGHTETVLFDPRAERPALLAPGDRVRFRSAS
ncbi:MULTISPECIES: 5-oxoprolinase subunit PxpB [Amycolatopsis]|uniref:Sensor histidine kinase inhibitor, KipI family n=2 Tax=Amycolatopsis TaxID=1813 RepID=A0A1I3RWU2_9PSEU|nr:5-oxoprolinase subunit PxpB [Amycolatopsis sacchari]SFJ50808.1 sensor histidine kinase inhibitor, KipI family [Amycolatopsis sacchari]